jgi:hypothetical protein
MNMHDLNIHALKINNSKEGKKSDYDGKICVDCLSVFKKFNFER